MKTVNMWCYNPAKNADKTYSISLLELDNGRCDVLSMSARRGTKGAFHPLKEGVSKFAAEKFFDQKLEEKFRHGYKVVQSLEGLEPNN